MIDAYKGCELYYSGLQMHQAGMLHTLSESQQHNWNRMHNGVQGTEKQIEKITKFFENSGHPWPRCCRVRFQAGEAPYTWLS